MTIARRDLVDQQTPGFYHCTNRCVSRTFLCGVDELTGQNFSHRKDWLEKRLFELSEIFSVEIFAYAVMDNHYHIVIYSEPLAPLSWTDEQIAERWLKAYPGNLNNPQLAKKRALKKQAIIGDRKKLAKYRQRLGSLSWFMGRLNEPIAKQSNTEDNCTGRFWEGRYSSQVLLDEAAVFSCMVYVDLNPVRARITDKLESSNNTGIKNRLEKLKEIEPSQARALLSANVNALSQTTKGKQLSMSLKAYVELVEWTGKNIVYPNKAKLPSHIAFSLQQLNLQQEHWLRQIENFNEHYCHVVGSVELIREKAKQLKKRCLKGVSAAKLLYECPH